MTDISLNYMQLLGSYIIFNYLTHILSLLVFLLQFTDIRYYHIYAEKDKFRDISKHIEQETYFAAYKYKNGRDSPTGYFVGWSCIGFFDTLDKYEDEGSIKIICSLSFYKKIIKEKTVTDAFLNSSTSEKQLIDVSNKIRIYNRYGTYKHFYYNHINLNLGAIYPIGQQAHVVDGICDIYNKYKRATIFIHGVSCAGKSSIGYLLAKKYSGRFCHSFNPTDAGNMIDYVINAMNSDKDDDSPNIIVLEEVDVIIKGIHTNSIPVNKDVPTLVYNKSTWSSFLDDMIFYNNVILILTSNESKESIDSLDPAYLRKGRINASFTMDTPLKLEYS
jgi:hypothetical protein